MVKRNRTWDTLKTVAVIGTYLPRRCGIATFTADLAGAISNIANNTNCWALALNDQPQGYRYPSRVKFEINHDRVTDYRVAADFLNMSPVDMICLQHEYGIFGAGENGENILELLRRVRVPVVTTLHTVLEKPTNGQYRTLIKAVELSDSVVVMAERAVHLLQKVYNIPSEKIRHIPHGIPDRPFVDPSYYKDQFGVEGRKVILTFGLLSPGKGIEHMIDALPRVVEAHGDVVYIVMGATHPHVQEASGEDYRLNLLRRARDRNVAEHVKFLNRFIELEELCEALGAADVYVTPYLSEAQIVSGTLAYALGTGNAVVSTPYWYAQEMLANDRGRLVPFGDERALADEIIDLFDHETKRHAMRKRAYKFTRGMIWPEVAGKYMDLFEQVKERRLQTPKPLFTHRRPPDRQPELPAVKLEHLCTMTDETGILQHARGIIPNRTEGYCTDDNARALIVALLARQHLSDAAICRVLVSRYLSFLDSAFDPQAGRFRNFMNYDRQWSQAQGSQDCHGRAIWALGEMVECSELRGQLIVATDLLHKALPALVAFKEPRAWAYGILGLNAYLRRFVGDTQVRRMRDELSHRLLGLFQTTHRSWLWPEPTLTYANARLPQALILSAQVMEEPGMLRQGLSTLQWLSEIQTAPAGHFSAIGNRGWYPRDGQKALFDQQPIEAASMTEAALAARAATNDDFWLDHAHRSINWFLGANDLRTPLFDPATGGCCDGLGPEGASDNQGAESTLAWLQASLALREYQLQAAQQRRPVTQSASHRSRTDPTAVAT